MKKERNKQKKSINNLILNGEKLTKLNLKSDFINLHVFLENFQKYRVTNFEQMLYIVSVYPADQSTSFTMHCG